MTSSSPYVFRRPERSFGQRMAMVWLTLQIVLGAAAGLLFVLILAIMAVDALEYEVTGKCTYCVLLVTEPLK